MPMLAFAQTDSVKAFKISAYLESYYTYDFNQPSNHVRSGFLYNYNRHNEVNINLGLLKAAYNTENVRGNIGFMVGTYPDANLAAEQGLLKNVYEANAGVKLSKTNNLWLDAGIFPSHIGWESAIGKDNKALTRSIAAENSPYYESGAKLTYITKDNKWLFSAMYLNGWQRIKRVDGNSTPAFGTQITFKPNANFTLNSSSFIGNDKPDASKQNRYFNDLYGNIQLNKSTLLTIGFDIGAEQMEKGSSNYNTWYSPNAILSYQLIDKLSLTGRVEYFQDKNGVIIQPNFKTWGFSGNVDYSMASNVLFRLETRLLNSNDKIFTRNTYPVNQNFAITGAIAIAFN